MLREHMEELLDGVAYIRVEIEKKKCMMSKIKEAHALCAGSPKGEGCALAAAILMEVLRENHALDAE